MPANFARDAFIPCGYTSRIGFQVHLDRGYVPFRHPIKFFYSNSNCRFDEQSYQCSSIVWAASNQKYASNDALNPVNTKRVPFWLFVCSKLLVVWVLFVLSKSYRFQCLDSILQRVFAGRREAQLGLALPTYVVPENVKLSSTFCSNLIVRYPEQHLLEQCILYSFSFLQSSV